MIEEKEVEIEENLLAKAAMDRIIKDEDFLKIPCKNVTKEEMDTPQIRNIIEDLVSTALDLDKANKLQCAGLSANQLGYNKRIFVIKMSGRYKVFINPEIIFANKTRSSTEGCFSFPGRQTTVDRFIDISVRCANQSGVKKLKKDKAIYFQHELDHLNGIAI